MRFSHILLAILVAALWGFSFVAAQKGLLDMPPFLLCAFRFLFTTFPLIFFVKKPATSWRIIASYGFCMFALAFSFTFFSIKVGLTAGLASLLLQLQVFFTILFCIIFLKERITLWQFIGVLISLGGLLIVGAHVNADVTLPGLLLIISGACSWGLANLASKLAGKINMLGLIVWGSLFAWPLLFLLSFIIDGSDAIRFSLTHLSGATIASILYMAYPATIIGFVLWSWMLSQYPTASVAPFSLLVPFFGMLSSMLVFHETLQSWKILAALFIVGGLAFNIFVPKLIGYLKGQNTNSEKGKRTALHDGQ
jgi:O-acetylserine/cysteine efflux transporter